MGINFAYGKIMEGNEEDYDLLYYSDFNWSYSGFHHFRTKLAKEIKINLMEMDGFGGNISFSDYDDDIILFLNHCDCEGNISVEDCKKVAPRLRKLIENWLDHDYDKVTAFKLADLMDKCIELNEELIFT